MCRFCSDIFYVDSFCNEFCMLFYSFYLQEKLKSTELVRFLLCYRVFDAIKFLIQAKQNHDLAWQKIALQ